MMKPNSRLFSAFFLFLLINLCGMLGAEDKILAAYEQNFVRANLSSKTGILKDAATDEKAADFIGDLYDYALIFALNHAEILSSDPDMVSMVVCAVQGLNAAGYAPALETLWRVFFNYMDPLVRVEIFKAIEHLGKGNSTMVENVNQFLISQNSLYMSGLPQDFSTLVACIHAISALGDESSFLALFSTMVTGYPDEITSEAAKALSAIPGDYKDHLIYVIQERPPNEKLAAFLLALDDKDFSGDEIGQIAEIALNVCLDFAPSSPEEETTSNRLRYEAVKVITAQKVSSASAAALRHFYLVQADFNEKKAALGQYIEAIDCLAAINTGEAAKALALQLGVFNSQVERRGKYEEKAVISIINALSVMGNKIAFDNLLSAENLHYTEPVLAAAKEALTQLQW